MASGSSAQFQGWIRPITPYRSGQSGLPILSSGAVCAGMMTHYEQMITNGAWGCSFSLYNFEAFYKLIQSVLTLLKGVFFLSLHRFRFGLANSSLFDHLSYKRVLFVDTWLKQEETKTFEQLLGLVKQCGLDGHSCSRVLALWF